MPVGNGVVVIGMGERTSHQAITQVARNAVRGRGGRAGDHRGLPRSPRRDAPGHRVHLLRPRPGHRVRPGRSTSIVPFSLRPDDSGAVGTGHPPRAEGSFLNTVGERARRAVPGRHHRRRRSTAPARAVGRRQQRASPSSPAWSSATTATPSPTPRCARPASRSITIDGQRARPRPRRRPLHDLPDPARPASDLIRPPKDETPWPSTTATADLLSLVHHTERDLHYLLDLSRDLKRAKYAGTERQRLRGKNIALIFEKTSTRTRCAFEVAAYDQGAHVTYLDPTVLADRAQGVDEGHRPGARAGCTTRSSTAASPRSIVESSPSTPACRSSTASPTSSTRPRCSPTC